MNTKNIQRILNDCDKYGDEPQTFCAEIVRGAVAEFDALKTQNAALLEALEETATELACQIALRFDCTLDQAKKYPTVVNARAAIAQAEPKSE